MERHDLRHRLQTATEMVARGDKVAALDFLDAAQKRLDEGKAIRWCRPPVAQKAGHGLGVQSISAFCRKNGAVCQFDLTDGWFRLRLVL